MRIAVVLSLILLAAPAAAQDGPLRTLMLGRYICERPGPSGSQTFVHDHETSFAVTNASRYRAADGTVGTYLMTGGTVTMTSGPLAGARFVRVRSAFLRRVESDGLPGPLRCVLSRSSDKH